MRKLLILIFTIIIISVIVSIGFKIFDMFSSDVKKMTNNREKDYILKEEYSGIVTKKYVDSLQHNYKTIIVKDEKSNKKLLFDFVLNDVYQFIKEGDSLSKNKGSLDLNLKRNDLDTIIHMEIYNRQGNRK